MPKFLPLVAMIACAMPAFTQEKADKAAEVKVQKDAATEKLAKASLPKPSFVETNDLIVYSTWPEPKLKTLAASVQKAYELAYKTLKFDPKDAVWPGKLTVFFLPERKEFTSFVRLVEQRKPDANDTASVQVRSKEPYILVGVEADSKFTEADVAGEVGAAVSEALLNTKSGVTAGAAMLPTWITGGFGKLMVLKMEGNGAKYTAYRAKVRALAGKGKAANFKASEAWSETKTKETEVVMVSVVEFLLFGPDPSKFSKVLSGFKPSDERPNPTLDQALEVADYKPDTLDTAWKAWLAKGK